MRSVSLSDILERGQNNFDLVRLVAAASVIVGHSFIIATGDLYAEPLTGVSSFTLGQHAVNVFFILSGLLVAASLERNSGLVPFMTGRVLRVFPGLAACVLLLSLAMGPFVTSLDPVSYFASTQTWRYLAATLSLATGHAPLPGVFEALPAAGEVNVSLWTLKYEMMCYGVLALLSALGLWLRPRLLWLALGALVGVQLVRLWHLHVDEFGVLDQVLRFLTCFFVGAGAYRLRDRLRLSPACAALAVAALALSWGTRLEPLVAYVAIGYLALCFSALPLGPMRRLCGRGDLSYGLYIYGWPVAQLLLLSAPGLGPVGLAGASLAVTLPLAALSWALVEKPALALKRRLRPKPAMPCARRSPVPAILPGAVLPGAVLPLTGERDGNYCPRP